MINKKGFTLIELIALLGIIAIIILLGAPSLINQIETTKKNNYNNFVSDLCLAAEAYINHNDIRIENSATTISLGELMTDGYVKSSLTNPKTKEKINAGDVLTINVTEDMTYSCTLNS